MCKFLPANPFDRALIASNGNPEKAAVTIGVKAATIRGWMETPEFGTLYRDALGRVFDKAMARLQVLSDVAVCKLSAILEDEKADPAVQMRAIKLAVDLGGNHVNHGLMARMDRIEKELAEQKRRRAA